MNPIVIKNLHLLLMLRAYLLFLLTPVYFLAFYYSTPLNAILYIFTVIVICGPLASMPDAADLKNRTHVVFFSLPVSRRQIALGNFYTGYIILGIVIVLIFLGSVPFSHLSGESL